MNSNQAMSFTSDNCHSKEDPCINDFSNFPESQSLAKGIEELL
jgi:hypothetical protein